MKRQDCDFGTREGRWWVNLGGWPAGHWGRGQEPICFKQLQLVLAGPGYHTSVLLGAPIPYCNRWDRLRQGAAFPLCLRRRDKTALQGTYCAQQALNGSPFTWFGLGPRLLKTSCPCPGHCPPRQISSPSWLHCHLASLYFMASFPYWRPNRGEFIPNQLHLTCLIHLRFKLMFHLKKGFCGF